jgi:hypothetical protein
VVSIFENCVNCVNCHAGRDCISTYVIDMGLTQGSSWD